MTRTPKKKSWWTTSVINPEQEKMTERMTGVSSEQVAKAVEAARKSWDEGLRAHVYKPSALSALEEEGLTEAIDAIMAIGWDLHSTALGMQTTGVNGQQGLFVFTRPRADG